MTQKTIVYLFALLSILTPSLAMADIDNCAVDGLAGYCIFPSLCLDHHKSVYFHCSVGLGNPYVKMTNHHILIRGYIAGRGPAAGTLTLGGLSDVKAALDHYYFEVKDDEHHPSPKFVYIISPMHIHCEIGKGKRQVVFPGMLG